MNTTDKLAEALTLGLECAYELLAEKRQALAGHPEKVAPYQEMADYLRRELAAHEQAQADDWQHLKPYGYAPGNYMSRCRTCGDTPVMDKRAITCRPCAEAKFAASQAQAERVGLTDEQIAEGRYLTWAAEPDDAPEAWSFMRGARWAEKHFGIGATTGEQR